MNDSFIFPLNGLAQGRNEFRLRAGKAFFESYENPEILDADLSVAVLIEKSGRDITVDCDIQGTVTVACDRCLEDLDIVVDEHPALAVRFGGPEEEDGEGDAREPVFLNPADTELDLSQTVYDYACLAVPIHKVHPEGGCNPETIRFLQTSEEPGAPAGDTPFAALRDLFEDNGK